MPPLSISSAQARTHDFHKEPMLKINALKKTYSAEEVYYDSESFTRNKRRPVPVIDWIRQRFKKGGSRQQRVSSLMGDSGARVGLWS